MTSVGRHRLSVTDSDVDVVACQFLTSDYADAVRADWPLGRRIDVFLRRRGLPGLADDGALFHIILDRVMTYLNEAQGFRPTSPADLNDGPSVDFCATQSIDDGSDRADCAARRAEELARLGAELAAGHRIDDDDLATARRGSAQARIRARRAHLAAERRHRRAAAAHRDAAEVHARAAESGVGDAAEHRRASAAHYAAADVDDREAEKARHHAELELDFAVGISRTASTARD